MKNLSELNINPLFTQPLFVLNILFINGILVICLIKQLLNGMMRFFLITAFVWAVFSIESCSGGEPEMSHQYSDSVILRTHVDEITKITYRNYLDTLALNQVAGYIESQFRMHSGRVIYQPFKLDGRVYKNVICSFGPQDGERLIIGAHYDVYGKLPGADDNASGVAGLLELSRLLKNENPKFRIDLVAYTLEEPPYFRSNGMGSYIHAQDLWQNKIPVKGMICLEMIGYFNVSPKSQDYPVGIMKWFYGNTGDYILIVQRFGNGSFGRQFNRLIKKNASIETKFLRSPKFLPGVDFSDHRNYWNFGFNAIMVTNTAFYRNENYHSAGDTLETLDFGRMSKVVDQVYISVVNLK